MMKLTYNIFPVFAFALVWFLIGICSVNGQSENKKENTNIPSLFQGCPPNSDSIYNRQAILRKLDQILKKSIPYYREFPSMGFFVYDLTDPSNNYRSWRDRLPEESCINFIDNHVYHFSASKLHSSKSQIVFLEDGKLKVFNSINCKNSKQNLASVISYVSEKLGDDKESIITRIKHYRRYGIYNTVDQTNWSCGEDEIPENSDKLYSRDEVLKQFLKQLVKTQSLDITKDYAVPRDYAFPRGYPSFFIQESRSVGFFIYDLTDPSNKQTSLDERIEFKNNHIYHFADIDLPFSFSNIAILEDGKIKFFRAINCTKKGDRLEDVIAFLNEKLNNDKNKDEILKRVKNYREYGVYTSFNGLSTLQCEEAVKIEK